MAIDTSKLQKFTVTNYFDETEAEVCPVDSDLELLETDAHRISEICNQDQVYDILFREKKEGEPYGTEDAKKFIDWARTGWSTHKYFVFLIKTHKDIIGAIDIKSADPDGAEIGYWMDAKSPGFMTNVVEELAKVAGKAGYMRLIAYTKLNNDKSAGVLERAGFEYEGDVDYKNRGIVHKKFSYQI